MIADSMRVLVADSVDSEQLEPLLGCGVEVVDRGGISAAELVVEIPAFDGLIVRSRTVVDAPVIAAGSRLRVIGRAGTGVDNIDLSAATRAGVVVMNVPGGNAVAAAEHTIALMTALARSVPQAAESLRAGRWERKTYKGIELTGKTLGVIGLGRIGTATALRAKAFKLRVVACDPYIPDGRGKALGVDMMEFDELLATSDIISLHTPLTEETHHMIAAQQLTAMKPTAVLVNTSRGAVVDLEALAGALETERIAGAAIDVFEVEPPEAEHPLVKCWRRDTKKHPTNLLLTPHIAFYSVMGFTDICTKAAAEVARVLRGEPGALHSPHVSRAITCPSVRSPLE